MQPSPAAQPPELPADDRPLRSVTAGYDIDRWPIAVPIGADETMQSWLSRAAGRYTITPRDLIAQAGIEDRIQRPGQLASVIRGHAERFAQLLGCDAGDVVAAAAEALPTAAVVDYLVRYHAVSRPVPAGTGFCPACLAQPHPRWKREWASLFGIACPTHGCLLVRACPRCGDVPFAATSWISLEPGTPMYACPNRPRRNNGRMMHGRRCGFDLRSIDLFDLDTAAIDAHTLAYQLWQSYTHDPHGAARIADISVTTTIAFDALCQLLDESIRVVSLFEEPLHRPALVQALRNAAQVLGAPTAAAAAERADHVGLLNPGGPITPIGPDNVLLRRKRNPLLAAIRLGAVRPTLSPAAQLTFDCGHAHPRYPLRENDDRRWLRLPEHEPEGAEFDRARIPQVLWPNTVWGDSRHDDPLAAAAQAMALIKIGDTRPWSMIALDLGLPKRIALPVTQYWRKIIRAGLWPEALTALTELNEQLRRCPATIDYQQRRIIADDPRRVVRALNAVGASSRSVSAEIFHDVVRRYWEIFTAGDIRYAPTPFAIPNDLHGAWPTKRHELDNEHGAIFESAFEWMLKSPGMRPGGPLAWRPP